MSRIQELQLLARGCSIEKMELKEPWEPGTYYMIDCHKNKKALFSEQIKPCDIERIAWLKE